jgi:hypothetical protein
MIKLFAPVEIEEAPRPERVKAPDVAVKFKAPVVRVRPLEAVRRLAEVTVPVPVVEIFPDVVTASPEVAGDNVVPVRFQNPIFPVVGAVVVNMSKPLV